MVRKQTACWALGAAAVGAWMYWQRRPRFDFRGKVVLITGGSHGLGLTLARQLAHQGADLAICARDPEELDRALHQLQEINPRCAGYACDVTDPQQVRSLIHDVNEELGPTDVLINNAGIIKAGPVESMTLDDFHEAMNGNFWSALHVILEVLPAMRRRSAGRIVNMPRSEARSACRT